MVRAEPGENAVLLVRGPSVFSGYLAAPGETPPDPFVAFAGEKWYRTGDLVSMDATGRLRFRGRLKRFAKVGGEMISLPQMEEVLQQSFASRGGAADGKPCIAVESSAGGEEPDQTAIVAFTTLPLTVQEINLVLRSAGFAPVYAVRAVKKLAELPLLGSGKIDYRALRDSA
jgi:acyl-CoA synthetase (AMP-forming)/AMP-acid ligase II